MSCEPKPDVVSSAAYHADTDNDYDVDTDDEGFTKTWPARDEDGRSRKRKKPSLEEEDDHEVRVQHPSIDIDNDQGGKKRDLPRDSNSNKQQKKRQKQKIDAFTIDLSGVSPQLPISKHANRMKEGASKYAGVHFCPRRTKWRTTICISGKNRHIGYYENDEEAAADYARAVFKYRGQEALAHARGKTHMILS